MQSETKFNSSLLANRLRSRLNDGTLNPQKDCSLFNRLPTELRMMIFQYVLAAQDDISKPYPYNRYYNRPGYNYHKTISTALLRTCRRIYLETYLYPVSLNELTAWLYRGPLLTNSNEVSKMAKMTHEQCAAVPCLHLFAQQYWLEDTKWHDLLKGLPTCPKSIHITLRHSDWWYWENGATLTLDPKQSRRAKVGVFKKATDAFDEGSWGQAFRHVQGLKEFKLELETIDPKKAELMAIVTHAPTWQFPLGDGRVLILDETKKISTSWLGPKKCHDDSLYQPVWPLRAYRATALTDILPVPPNLLDYHVQLVLLEQQNKKRLLEEQRQKQNYFVVTLTWIARSVVEEGERAE